MLPIKDDIPTRSFPFLTVAIIVICVVVYFLFERGGLSLSETGNERVIEYGAVPYELTHPGKECVDPGAGATKLSCEGLDGFDGQAPSQPNTWLTILTSMFMHGDILHLGGNMLFLWIFGNNIEDSMSRWRFILFYLIGGAAALGAQALIDPDAAIPTVGASGAIAAVLGGYALLYPRARVITVIFIVIFFTIVALPALLVLGLWILIQVLFGVYELGQPVGEAGGVAYFAHIGGFVFGLILIKLFANNVHEDYEAPRREPVY